ncbi:MAG TPA: hypothetical protein VNO32_39430 [Candidatus Acidoferrum sp.]|jgi:hypothetical protein|nr:hypothetical protein [Candidatus Acidoferrum sp.]
MHRSMYFRRQALAFTILASSKTGHDRCRSPEIPEVNWRELFRAAILELDPVLLQVRVKAAEDAINARLADAQIPRDERRDIDSALSAFGD